MVKFNLSFVTMCLGVICPQFSEGRWQLARPNQAVNKFGCEFDDKDFSVSSDARSYPVYGIRVKPMDFANMKEFYQIVKEISEEYSKLLQELVHTNIPEFYDFYGTYIDDYKRFRDKNSKEDERNAFVKFYQDHYTPQFYPRHGDASMSIELLERLIRRYPKMRGSVHLVTSSVLTDKTSWIKEYYSQPTRLGGESNQDLPTFIHDHVAAVLRVRVDGYKLGYILMDPGYGVETPLIILDDEHLQAEGNTLLYMPRKDYIIAMSTSNGPNHPSHLFYVGKPYCSFLRTTTKPHVLDTSRYIQRRNAQGEEIASITFDVTETDIELFHMKLVALNGTQIVERIRLSRVFKDKQQHYMNVFGAINHPGLEKLLINARVVSEDKQFLAKFSNLVDHYRNILTKANGNTPFTPIPF